MASNLTAKQQRFVEEYLVDLNASAAARRAGYSARTADAIGRETLGKPTVAAAIAERQRVLQAKVEVTQEMVLRELKKIAFGDQRRVMSWGPRGVTLRASEDLSADDAAVVSEVSETVTQHGGSLKLKTHDKVGALKLLGEHLGLFTRKVEVTGKDGKPLIPSALMEMTDEQLAAIASSGGSAAAS
jgi:phage terminase small subunit